MIPIDTTMQIFWRHPVAIIFLMIYTLLCIRLLNVEFQVRELIKMDREARGVGAEATGDSGLLILMFGISFFVNGGYAIANKVETKFYLWLIFITIIELIAVFKIG